MVPSSPRQLVTGTEPLSVYITTRSTVLMKELFPEPAGPNTPILSWVTSSISSPRKLSRLILSPSWYIFNWYQSRQSSASNSNLFRSSSSLLFSSSFLSFCRCCLNFSLQLSCSCCFSFSMRSLSSFSSSFISFSSRLACVASAPYLSSLVLSS